MFDLILDSVDDFHTVEERRLHRIFGGLHVIAMSVLVLNLRKIQCAILRLLTYLLAIFMPAEKWAIVQQTLDKKQFANCNNKLDTPW